MNKDALRRLTVLMLATCGAAGEVLGLLGAGQAEAATEPGTDVPVASIAPASESKNDALRRSLRMPEAQAFDGDKPLPSVEEVTKLCRQGKRCAFKAEGESDYQSGVISVGNSFLNCSNHDISISRFVTLHPAVTDNVGGNVSGQSNTSGTITDTSMAQTSGTAQGTETIQKTNQTWNPSSGQATSSDINSSTTQGQLTGSIQSQNTGSKSSQQTYQSTAGRTYGRTWQTTIDDGFQANVVAPPGDVLQLGYTEMGKRVHGTLSVPGTSKYVKNVVVNEPSIIESSSFVVQTYTAPRGSCIDNRPTTPRYP